MSQKTLVSDQKEEIHEEESEDTVSQIGDETVLGLRNTELTDRNGQRIKGQLLKIVKTEVLEGNQVINECLKYWLKVFKQEEEIVVNEEDMFLVINETREDTSSQFYDGFTSIQRGVIEYMTAIREMRDKLPFEREFAGKEHEKDIAEGYIFKGIQEVWVAAMSETTSTAILRVVAEIKSRKVEEGNQYFENKCIECSKVQWESNQNKIFFSRKLN